MNIEVSSLQLGVLGTNCYIISNHNHDCLVVDPGGDFSLLDSHLKSKKLTPEAIILTHAHFDHIGAVEELRTAYHVPVYMHEKEKDWLVDPSKNGSELFGVGRIASSKLPEYSLDEGDAQVGNFSFQVLYTPGHSPGSISLWFESNQLLIAGDTLFQGSIGRTDLPFGDHDQLINGIKSKILTLPNETVVCPGHGPQTTVEAEKQHNPFL